MRYRCLASPSQYHIPAKATDKLIHGMSDYQIRGMKLEVGKPIVIQEVRRDEQADNALIFSLCLCMYCGVVYKEEPA